ncbi:MAG TPA: 5'-methylthioadenosine/S-adenosylhomocysteine nucleosidase [Pseudonocardiaceae bacterium]|nr:5'-methylthioadenosine/S-adenosylhomocysteine nucleosidase [Pseudonocardiaceae bacterium]
MNGNLVVMLSALDLEYDAIRTGLTNPHVHRHAKGTRFEVGELAGGAGQAALALVGKGNHTAAVLAERAIDQFSPVAVVFVGVAGALWPSVALGDVVVATHVYAYHGATSDDDGLKARPRVWEISHKEIQIAHHLARIGDWVSRLLPETPPPQVHFGTVAAGEIVQDSRISHEARWIRQHYNDAIAIEMEAAGVAQAGHLNASPVVVIRGISDRADGSKATSDESNWQPRAAANAAAFATRLAEELIKEGQATTMQSRSSATGTTVNNIASGTVGIQAAQVIGSTVMLGMLPVLPTAPSVGAELASFREQLARARSAGHLDVVTYAAAEAELEIADRALTENSSNGKHNLVLALKRLRGLVADVADLAAKVAALITALKGSL